MAEISATLIQFGEITSRLVELRAGGWHIEDQHGYYGDKLRYFGFIKNPLNDQVELSFPLQRLSTSRRKRPKQLKKILQDLQTLPDSPSLVTNVEDSASKLDSFGEYLTERA